MWVVCGVAYVLRSTFLASAYDVRLSWCRARAKCVCARQAASHLQEAGKGVLVKLVLKTTRLLFKCRQCTCRRHIEASAQGLYESLTRTSWKPATMSSRQEGNLP